MLLFHFLTRHINAQAHHYQMYAVNHNIFPVHLNAVITLVTVPIETVGSCVVFVAEAPTICAPRMDLLSKLLRLHPKSNSTVFVQHFFYIPESISRSSAPVCKYLHFLCFSIH